MNILTVAFIGLWIAICILGIIVKILSDKLNEVEQDVKLIAKTFLAVCKNNEK